MSELLKIFDSENYRFELKTNMFDISEKYINNKGQMIISIKRPDDSFLYDDIFELMARETDDPEYDQTPNLDLVIQKNANNLIQCFLGANIKSDFFDDTYETVEILLNDKEKVIVNQILKCEVQNIKAG